MHRIERDGNRELKRANENIKKYGTFDPNISEMAKSAMEFAKQSNEKKDKVKEISTKIWDSYDITRREIHETIYEGIINFQK